MISGLANQLRNVKVENDFFFFFLIEILGLGARGTVFSGIGNERLLNLSLLFSNVERTT